MEAVRTEHIDGGGGGEVGGGDGGGSGEEGAAPRRQPLPLPLLHPLAASAKQHKERHIVAWTPQEDDLLREQVGIHGTENWTCIAAQFKDKTARQCRRRWFSYLNTECKKGGWSQEEDMVLCEVGIQHLLEHLPFVKLLMHECFNDKPFFLDFRSSY